MSRKPMAERVLKQLPVVTIPEKKKGNLNQPIYMGLVVVPGGKIVTTDHNNRKCCVLDEGCKVTEELPLPYDDWGLSSIGNGEVAVVFPWERSLQIMSVDPALKIKRTVQLERKYPLCVARVSDAKLAVAYADAGYAIISRDGEEKMYVDKDSSGRPIKFAFNSSIAVDATRQRIYMSMGGKEDVVYCFELSGKLVFDYTHGNLKKPRGLTLDQEGNLYICSAGNDKVHQISPAGALIREISSGIREPFSLCFYPDYNQLLVMNWAVDTNTSTHAVAIKFD